MNESELRAQLEQLHADSYGWALSCCSRDGIEAADVLQTVYVKVLEGKARYEGRSAFKTWLFSVISRTAADERRRHWFRRLGFAKWLGEQGDGEPFTEDAVALDKEEQSKELRGALEKLPRRQMEVLHLVFYQEMTVEEASAVMGVSLGSARTHYERGKRNLRGQLKTSEAIHAD